MSGPLTTLDPKLLDNLCRRFGVARLQVFGSVLRQDFDPDRSDVDLLVEFLPGASRGLFKLVQMQAELTEMFGREVDLTTPGSLGDRLRQRVLESARVIYDAA